MIVIETENVDGVVFKSANHGLDADFLELFAYAVDKYEVLDGKNKLGKGKAII